MSIRFGHVRALELLEPEKHGISVGDEAFLQQGLNLEVFAPK